MRRVGAHRRWDAEGLAEVRGVPWHWDPNSEIEAQKLLVRHPTDAEKAEKVGELKLAIAGAGAEDWTEQRLSAYLKRTKFDVARAADMVRATVAWRRQNLPVPRTVGVEKLLQSTRFRRLGFNRENRLVAGRS